MEGYIQISKLNDFIFCPYSLYLHNIYDQFDDVNYKSQPQILGTVSHSLIDNQSYSSSKDWLQGMPVYSDEYKLVGKIDLYNVKTKVLVERKHRIKKIYDGYKYQLYAQYFALKEQGFNINGLFLHSLADNKRYEVELPNEHTTNKFAKLISEMLSYLPVISPIVTSAKCNNCIYSTLCAYAKSS